MDSIGLKFTNQESSEKHAENQHLVITRCSISNENLQLSDYIKISDEIDLSKINSEFKNQKSGLMIPSKLYENLNHQIPKFQKINLDSINFVPIWHINGSQKSRAEVTELYTTFEILIYILSKRFVTFKAELLSLCSTEIQYAKIKGYTVEDYSSYERSSG